jgi:4-aminobutyrate aminotransferase / (S)-3-amino-2-methylpropionate transaminase / 5-aminovalerate transaminase
MLAMELVDDRETRKPDGDLARRAIELARERGLILLACGMYGNVLRLLPPLVDADQELDEGLAILEGVLVDASSGAG